MLERTESILIRLLWIFYIVELISGQEMIDSQNALLMY